MPPESTTVKPDSRSAARNWLYADSGDTGLSVLSVIVPFTRGSTTMLRPVIAAIVRATASMSALTKFSVTGSRDARARCVGCCANAGPLATSAQASASAVDRERRERGLCRFILSDRDDRARAAASHEDVQQVFL